MYEYQATVNQVIDGDTIDVTIDLGFSIYQKQRVRLYGINAPETNSKDVGEREAGLSAKVFLADKVINHQVKLYSVKPKDKYGRYLAVVWLTDGIQAESLNDTMIRLGLAKPWDGQGEKPV